MQTYFRGERAAGMALLPIGLGLLALAFWLWRNETGGFALGLAIPLTILGALGAIGGAGLAIKTDSQVADLTQQLEEDPAALVAAELPRMEKVNANWPRLKIAWVVITLVAMGMIMLVKRDWATGIGLTLMLACALLFWVDVFAERRAEPYTRALERVAAESG